MAKGYRKVDKEKSYSIADTQGKLLTEPEEVDRRWCEYFRGQLNTEERDLDADVDGGDLAQGWERDEVLGEGPSDDGGDITIEEVTAALKQMRNNNAAGSDEIPAEVFKYGGQHVLRFLVWIFNLAWRSKRIPKEWGSAVIFPIHKKGDRTNCTNYRPISLLSHIGKIYERILERRLRHRVEETLHEGQHGFRPNRGAIDLCFALKILLEKSWEFNYQRYLAFLDLEKAFDRVPRKQLWRAMRHAEYRIPLPLRMAIRSLYESNQTTVRSIGGAATWFNAGSGVRQGSVISPLLFIILMDRVIKSAEAQEPVKKPGEADKFAYADDIGVVEENSESLSLSINLWNTVLRDHGLSLNLSKTEVMVVSREHEPFLVNVEGTTLKQTSTFRYLGVLFDSNGTHETAIRDRIQKYSANVNLLYPMLKDRNVPRKVKTTVYKTILRPTLCYGCETWTLTTRTRSCVQAAEMRVLRLIRGVTRRDRLRNENIRRELGVESVLAFVERAQLRWFGHLMRMEDHRTPKKWYMWKPHTRRPRGRPRKRWEENIAEALRARGTSLWKVRRRSTFRDRESWRRLVADRPLGLPGDG
jgi:hypothetical protein